MDPNEKNNWIELVNHLVEINSSVREDIRDSLLLDPKNIKKNKILSSESSNLNESNLPSKEITRKNTINKKHHLVRKNTTKSNSRRDSKLHSSKKNSFRIII